MRGRLSRDPAALGRSARGPMSRIESRVMHAGRTIAWIAAVALGAGAASCARAPIERSSVTADLASGTESPGLAQAPGPAQGFGLDASVSLPTPSLDAGGSLPLPSLDAGGSFPSPGFDGGAPFAPFRADPGAAEPAHDPMFDGGVPPIAEDGSVPEPIDLDAAGAPDVDAAGVDPIEVDAGVAPQPM